MNNEIIGYTLIIAACVIVFGGMTVFMIHEFGVKVAIGIWAATITILTMFVTGVYLVDGHV